MTEYRDFDATEVEKEKLRQVGETKRVRWQTLKACVEFKYSSAVTMTLRVATDTSNTMLVRMGSSQCVSVRARDE